MRTSHAVLVAVLWVSAQSLAQTRLHVPSQFPTLATAVAAAHDGDTVELAAGTHATNSATITKALHIVGVGATLNGTLTFAIPAGKALTMSGCRLGELSVPWSIPVAIIDLRINACLGRVTIGDALPGYGTITVTASPQVLLRSIVLNDNVNWAFGAALTVRDSTVVLDSCSFAGFRGLEDVYRPGPAASFTNSDVRCRNTTFQGGDGLVWHGNTNRGREAIEATLGTLRLQAGTVVDTGVLGTAPPLLLAGGMTIIDPTVNATWTANGNAIVTRVALPVVNATGLVAGGVAAIGLHSHPGTLGALLFGFPADRRGVPGVAGDAWLDPATMCVPVVGVQNGMLGWTTAVPAIWPWPVEFRWQGLVLDQGTLQLTDPGAAVLR